MKQNGVTYIVETPGPQDIDAVKAYYADPSRPATVFERVGPVLEDAVQRGLVTLLKNPDGDIVAASAVYTFPGDLPIGLKTSTNKAISTPFFFAEIGSVWRRALAPKGFIRELMYNAGVLKTLQYAKDAAVINAVVTQIVANDNKSNEAIVKLGMGWDGFIPGQGFTDSFRETVADEKSKQLELQSYIASVGPAVSIAARSLLGLEPAGKFKAVEKLRGYVEAYDYASDTTVKLNMRGTGLIETAEIVERRMPLLGLSDSWSVAAKEILSPPGNGLSHRDPAPNEPGQGPKGMTSSLARVECG